MTNRSTRKRRQAVAEWYGQMVLCFKEKLTDKERTELFEFERQFVDGSGRYGTSDWPGWEKHIGKFPPRSGPNPAWRRRA